MPDPIDVAVGKHLRARRQELGMSQETLAEGLGLTFQQVQKYEKGANRMAASTLVRAAATLQVPVGYFFEEINPESDRPIDPSLSVEATKLARNYMMIASPAVRRSLLSLVQKLVEGSHRKQKDNSPDGD